MTSRNRQRGKRWERSVRDYLKRHGLVVVKPQEGAAADLGDAIVVGKHPWMLEMKDEQAIDLPGYLREVATQQVNAGIPFGAAVVKARRQSVGDAYLVMRLSDLPRLLEATEALP
ncbi:MAG: hypothetical protein ACRDUY_08200 [Nitriliruptorales bacterium]